MKWSEGPVWDKKAHALLFTDIPNNRVMKWSQKDGLMEFLKPSGYTGKAEFKGAEPGANGLAFDKNGRLVLCQHGDRRVARLGKDGKFETLAGKYMGKRLNSPNDLVFDNRTATSTSPIRLMACRAMSTTPRTPPRNWTSRAFTGSRRRVSSRCSRRR